MARARWISPDDHVDERYLDRDGRIVSRDARQVLLCLKHLADRAGRLEDRPQTIRMRFFPCDLDLDVDACLRALAELPVPPIIRYEVGGRRLVQLTWPWERIRPDKTEGPSKMPPPPGPAAPAPPAAGPGGTPAAPAEGPRDTTEDTRAHPRVTQEPAEGATVAAPAEVEAKAESRDGGTDVVAGSVPPLEQLDHERARAREGGARIPRCTKATARGTCGHELTRERGMYRSEGTGGQGWRCSPREGGCGALYPREAPEVLGQLSAHARGALARELAAEATGRPKLAAVEAEASRVVKMASARVAGLVDEFVHGQQANAGAAEAFALWGELCSTIALELHAHAYATWFRATAGVRLDGHRLTVAVPNDHYANWIPKQYRDAIANAVERHGRGELEITFRTEGQLLLERFMAWAGAKGLEGELRLEVLQAVRKQLGEPAA